MFLEVREIGVLSLRVPDIEYVFMGSGHVRKDSLWDNTGSEALPSCGTDLFQVVHPQRDGLSVDRQVSR